MHYKSKIIKYILNIFSYLSCLALNEYHYECWKNAGDILEKLKRYDEAF